MSKQKKSKKKIKTKFHAPQEVKDRTVELYNQLSDTLSKVERARGVRTQILSEFSEYTKEQIDEGWVGRIVDKADKNGTGQRPKELTTNTITIPKKNSKRHNGTTTIVFQPSEVGAQPITECIDAQMADWLLMTIHMWGGSPPNAV